MAMVQGSPPPIPTPANPAQPPSLPHPTPVDTWRASNFFEGIYTVPAYVDEGDKGNQHLMFQDP